MKYPAWIIVGAAPAANLHNETAFAPGGAPTGVQLSSCRINRGRGRCPFGGRAGTDATGRLLLSLALAVTAVAAWAQDADVRVFAAGSLRAPMTDIAQAFTAAGGGRVATTFGASGLLRERIEKGERADVFASADTGNPATLHRAGRAPVPIVFTRNSLCALAAPGVDVTTETLLDRMLEPATKLGTSTPKADPSGDYAWKLFEKADAQRPGALRVLDAKALQLTGGPSSPAPPPDRSIYGVMVAERKADVFLTYCTNAKQAAAEVPGARVVAVPEALAVGADYGMATIGEATPAATRFVEFVLSPAGQGILARYGFATVR
jgi:ABC-type molybdate transport system substrate-binding protein